MTSGTQIWELGTLIDDRCPYSFGSHRRWSSCHTYESKVIELEGRYIGRKTWVIHTLLVKMFFSTSYQVVTYISSRRRKSSFSNTHTVNDIDQTEFNLDRQKLSIILYRSFQSVVLLFDEQIVQQTSFMFTSNYQTGITGCFHSAFSLTCQIHEPRK